MPCRLACNRYSSVDSVFEAQGDSNDVFLPPLPTSKPLPRYLNTAKSCDSKENMEYEPEINVEGFQVDNPGVSDVVCKRCLRRHNYRIADSCNYNQSYSWDTQMLYKNNPPVNMVNMVYTPAPIENYEHEYTYYPSQNPPQANPAPRMPQMPQMPQMSVQKSGSSCGCELSDMDQPYIQESQPEKYNRSPTWYNQREFRENNNNFY